MLEKLAFFTWGSGDGDRASTTMSTSATSDNRLQSIELSEKALQCPEKRRAMSNYYFRLFNRTVFCNKLPADLAIYWNKRLLTTAGRCFQATIVDKKVAFIQLSVKICDTPDRVRDTLLHEMCHAATWILDGIQHTDHGQCFQFWAERARRAHPDLPPVNSYHSYAIRTEFTYRCTKCSHKVGRHTQSLNVNKKVCGYCGGRFQLMKESGDRKTKTSSNTLVRKSQSFAHYVRDNLKRVKQRNKYLSNKAILLKLSKEYDRLTYR